MPTITPDTTLGKLVASDSRRADIFKQLNLDYCCGGDRTLADACRERDLDPSTVVRMLTAVSQVPAAAPPTEDPAAMPANELIDNIIERHHDYLRRTLPRLEKQLATVVHVHGREAPWMHDVQEVFSDLQAEQLEHLEKEEEMLFPMIRTLDENERSKEKREALLRELEDEHAAAGAALRQIRELTDGFSPPEWACHTFRTLLEELEELETNTHTHVHKENNILFQQVRERIT